MTTKKTTSKSKKAKKAKASTIKKFVNKKGAPANAQAQTKLTAAQEKQLKEMYEAYQQRIGELLFFLERSYLPMERKLFFQIALLKGHLSDDLMDKMIEEMAAATKELEQSIKKHEQELEKDYEEIEKLYRQYFANAKALRHFKHNFREKLVKRTEEEIEKTIGKEEVEKIETIKTKLKKHGHK